MTLLLVIIGIAFLAAICGGGSEDGSFLQDPLPPGLDDARYDMNLDGKLDEREKSVQRYDWDCKANRESNEQ